MDKPKSETDSNSIKEEDESEWVKKIKREKSWDLESIQNKGVLGIQGGK